jgi:hypothetical protein
MSDEITTEPQVNIDVAQEREKPRLLAILFFDFFNETSEGKINLLGIFDRIYVPPTKKRSPPVGLFIRFNYVLNGLVQIVFFSPNNKPTGGFAFSTDDIKDRKEGQNQLQIFVKTEFDTPEEGDYWIDVSYRGLSLGGCKLTVEFRDIEGTGHGDIRGNTSSNLV